MSEPEGMAQADAPDPTQQTTPAPSLAALLRLEQRQRWQRGERVRVEVYLESYPALGADTEGVLDLIYNEVVLREDQGEAPELNDYLGRFPHFASQLRDQFEVFQALKEGSLKELPLTEEHAGPPAGAPAALVPAGDRMSVPGYELLGELGRGGMGVVYKAWHVQLRRVVALKMLRAGVDAGSQERTRFRTEAEAVARLQHPNFVQIYEVGEHEAQPYFVLEYVDGGSLLKKLAGTPLPARQAAELVATLARAIHYAHQRGIVHRDLSPGNVLLTADGTPKITDFGLAKILVGTGVGRTQSGAILGTPSYMAPEQAGGKSKEIGPAADVYALGAILYEVLTGRPPFNAETPLDTMLQVVTEEPVSPSRLQPRTPRDLVTISLKCLEKTPGKRYASAEALADDLERFLADRPIRARPVSQAERAWRWCRRNPAVACLLASLIVVLSGGLASVTSLWLLAEGRRGEAQQALEQEQQSSYFHRIALAHHEWLADNVDRAEELLRGCPPTVRAWEWHYLNRLCHAELLKLGGHTAWTGAVAFSPDGKRLASGGADGVVLISQAVTGEQLLTLKGHTRYILCVAFSPDGRWLASASGSWVEDNQRGEIIIWDAVDGREVRRLAPGHTKGVNYVAFSPDGRLLASAGSDQTVRIWDAMTGQELRALGHTRYVVCAVFSPDGRRLASAGGDTGKSGEVKIWDTATWQEIRDLPGHTDLARSVAFSPDGQQLASTGRDGRIHLWQVSTGEKLHTIANYTSFMTVSFSPDGRHLASTSWWDKSVRIWDAQTGQALRTLRGYSAKGVAFSPDGQRLASASAPVVIWDLTSDPEVRTLRGHAGSVAYVAFHPDSKHLASTGEDKTVKIWDALTGRVTFNVQRTHKVLSVAFSPDGQYLASAGENKLVKIWDTRTGEEAHSLTGHTARVNSVAFSPNGQLVASASHDKTVRLWDTMTGRILHSLDKHTHAVTSVAFSPDGEHLVTGSHDKTVRLWETRTGRPLPLLLDHGNMVVHVTISPDGRRLASTSGRPSESVQPSEVKVWDAITGRELFTLRDISASFRGAAFSRDGQRLLTASEDRTVKFWDAMTGRDVLTLGVLSDEANHATFSADGDRVAVACRDGTVKVWDTKEEKPEDRTARHEARVVAWHAAQAQDAERARQWFAAVWHLERLLQGERANESYRDRARLGEVYAEQEQWDNASAELAKATEDGAATQTDGAHYALLRLHQGDRDGYLRACAKLLERFAKMEDPRTANELAWICVLGSRADVDLHVQLASKAVARERSNSYLNTLGAALYRAGKYEAAIERLNEAIKVHGRRGTAWDRFFLAMAHHHLGHEEVAQQERNMAVQWMEQALQEKIRDAQIRIPLPWNNRLELQLLHREAEALLSQATPAAKK